MDLLVLLFYEDFHFLPPIDNIYVNLYYFANEKIKNNLGNFSDRHYIPDHCRY